ncbi:hypothetical protein A259_21010, partial [Pseudomonas syringae pv. actinidiae ICMP 19070]
MRLTVFHMEFTIKAVSGRAVLLWRLVEVFPFGALEAEQAVVFRCFALFIVMDRVVRVFHLVAPVGLQQPVSRQITVPVVLFFRGFLLFIMVDEVTDNSAYYGNHYPDQKERPGQRGGRS